MVRAALPTLLLLLPPLLPAGAQAPTRSMPYGAEPFVAKPSVKSAKPKKDDAEADKPANPDEEVIVTAERRRALLNEAERDAKHRADYARLKAKFDPDKPPPSDADVLAQPMATNRGNSALRDYMSGR